MKKQILGTLILFSLIVMGSMVYAGDIIHDAEYYILEAQNGEKWAAEDKVIDKKLAELRKKFGKSPNIIHIIWDDMKYGAIGHPMLNNVTAISRQTSTNWRKRG